MLTRLRVDGFKNLVSLDVRFGPFTCIAGANGVGKSNLFDAIAFLAALADKPLLDAAMSVRDPGERTGDVRSLFHRVGKTLVDEMSFDIEMIVPAEGTDDLGQAARATITFLRYELVIGRRAGNGTSALGGLEILRESLTHVRKGDAHTHLGFPHSVRKWRDSVVRGHGSGHRTAPFISTERSGEGRIIKIHQDGGGSGKPRSLLASSLPRTVLSVANAAEGPTATLARKEMQSWRILQLEPSKLREPDPFTAPPRMAADGSHLPATLFHLARAGGAGTMNGGGSESPVEDAVYSRIANNLAELIDDVRSVRVDKDERRELFTVNVTTRDNTIHPARSLSDGTLRFLALAVMDLDASATGLVCLEEPENGIHPSRIPAMLKMLGSIAVDPQEPVGADNPLRQVIVNTHSPVVVAEVDEEDVLLADLKEDVRSGRRFERLALECLPGSWRNRIGIHVAAKGLLLYYLSPVQPINSPERRRVVDRADMQQLLPGFAERR